jgi:hypothetical protein
MNTWQLFYKGTALEYPFEQQPRLVALWERTIIMGLQCGVSIETQKKNIKEDLDELEEYILGLVGGKEYTNEDIKEQIGDTLYRLLLNKWGLNVVCGLKLKVIENNEMNGHLFMKA